MPTRYFVFGPNDATEEEFEKFLQPQLEEILRDDPDPIFVLREGRMGKGMDYHAFGYLKKFLQQIKVITYIKNKDKNYKYIESYGLETYIWLDKKHDQIDQLATITTDVDVYWQRPEESKQQLYGEKYNPNYVDAVTRNVQRRNLQ